uniref:GP-PDE domain-containing protein n=1 Tax=Aplanochytrium stocchinoi TaxID=215587 RepID=A0A7S3PPZ0_9STRA
MVNFGAHLAASQVKGWEKYYVDYDALRAACSKESQCSIDEFFSLWKFELDKAQAFFEKISRETLKSLISLRSSNALADRLCCSLPGLSKSLNRGYNDTISEISLDLDDLEKGLQEVISKSLPLFDNRRQFCLLNVEALRKSASKCSKYLDSRMGDHLFALLSMSPMASSLAYDFGANLSAIIHEIEENKCRNLENATTKSNDQRELINRKQINGRSGSQDSIYDELDSPFDLLCVMMNNMDPEVKKRLVSHRGFHSTQDRLERPLENTLAAYEQAWAAGVHYCECDVTLTLDQRIVLCHDPELYRLAHNKVKTSKSEVSKGILPITQLTFDELLTFPLKNGSHAPLLEDVLRSARRVGPEAKLIIEIKSGVHGSKVASTLCYMLCASPELLSHVAVIMSFDLYIVHNFCKFFDAELATVECTRPKVFIVVIYNV